MNYKISLGELLIFCSMWSIITSLRQPRLSLAEQGPSYYISNVNGIPGTYSFGYDTLDPSTGNTQYRNEERLPNGTVVGGYGYVDANGSPVNFRYIADERGYRVSKVRPQPVSRPVPMMTVPQYIDREDTKTWSRKKLQHKQNKPQYKYNYKNTPFYY